MTTTSVQSIWLLLLDDTLRNPIARCTRCKNLRYARIAWEILRRNFIQSKLSTNWSPKEDQGATTGLLCVLQNGSPIFHNFLDTMLTQNTWCWWAGGVPWGHYFVGSNPHGCYHFVGVPIPFCKGVGWAPYTLVCPTSRSEFQGGSKMSVSRTAARSPVNTWQPSHVYAGLDQTCHLNMPTWAWAEQLHAPRWTARSHLRRFGTNMPLKHAKMSMSRTAARSSLKYLTARSRLCRVRANIHLNMPPWAWAEHLTLPAEYLTARSRLCRFPANMAWNMPTWAWAEQRRNTCKTQSASTKKRKVTWNLQFHCARKSTGIDDKARIAAPVAQASRLSSATMNIRLPEKNTMFPANLDVSLPMRSAKSDLQNAIILARRHCRTSTLREASTQHSTAICTDTIELQHRAHRFDAAVPLRKVSRHMQNTIAQHPQRREKVTWVFSSTARANRTGIDGKARIAAPVTLPLLYVDLLYVYTGADWTQWSLG